MVLLTLYAMAVSQIAVSTHEPRSASPWVQSTRASCGQVAVLISGYGAANPLGQRPSIKIGGRPARGSGVTRLLDDLSHRRAAYRLTISCGRRSEVTLRIHEGEKLEDGTIRYRSAVAYLEKERLASYSGLQDANAETFWYR